MKRKIGIIALILLFSLLLTACRGEFVGQEDPDKIKSDGNKQVESGGNEPPEKIPTLTLPVFEITTEENAPIVSKDEYLACTVSVGNTDEKYVLSEEEGKIKGRGNTSWEFPKKSYKLKFDSKIDLFGNGKAKTWTLIANYDDQSLIRNLLAYSIASALTDLKTTTTTQSVELYLNGEYLGVYLVCEQTETGKTRVDIPDDPLEYAPDEIGYLIELSKRSVDEGEENFDWFGEGELIYGVKAPDPEDEGFSADYTSYISEFIDHAYLDVLDSGDYEEVSKIFDIGSFVDGYIVHELFNCCDVGCESFFMYMYDGKLYCGPMWDFDISAGNCYYNTSACPELLWAATHSFWYGKLLTYPEFAALVGQRLYGYKDIITTIIEDTISECRKYGDSFEKNFEKWELLGVNTWPNTEEIAALETWEAHVDYVKNWLSQSLAFMLQSYPKVSE